jgi:hypothetical protein
LKHAALLGPILEPVPSEGDGIARLNLSVSEEEQNGDITHFCPLKGAAATADPPF